MTYLEFLELQLFLNAWNFEDEIHAQEYADHFIDLYS